MKARKNKYLDTGMERLTVNSKIELERLKFTHAFQVFQAIELNREFLSPWLPFVQDTEAQEDTEAFIRSVNSKPAAGRDEVYVIWYEKNFAGLIGYKDLDRVNLKVEVGYWLIEAMTGKGIISMSTKALVDFAFTNMGMNRVEIRCGVGNFKSAAVPKRIGFIFEGVAREGEKHQDKFIDLEVYSCLRNEWPH